METTPTSPRQRFWLALMALTGLAGLVDSVLIHLKEIDSSAGNAQAFASCSISALINCESAYKSIYGHFLGMPVSLLGIMFYVAAISGVVALFLGLPRRTWLLHAGTAALALSLLFSLRLLFYSYFALGAFCPYCLVSDVATLLMLFFWLPYAYSKRSR